MLPKRWFAQRSAGKNASVTMIISRPIVKANEKRGTDSSNGVGLFGPRSNNSSIKNLATRMGQFRKI